MTEIYTGSKRQRRVAVIIIVLSILAIAAIIAGAFILGSGNYEKNRLKRAVIYSTPTEASTVADCLVFWEFPAFNEELIEAIEVRYDYHFYKEIGEDVEVARTAANHFIDNFYDTLDREDKDSVTQAVAASYIAAVGDTYGYYRTAEQANEFNSDMSGKTVGIGVTVTKDVERGIPIIDIIENSPAEKAGLLIGDLITKIDGESIVGKDYDESVNKIRGEKGSSVTLEIKRGDKELTVDVIRDEVIQKTVSGSMLDGNIAYIKISSFKKNTDELFAAELDKLLSAGAVGVIFDVSVNPGGYLDSVTNMLSYLTPTGTKLAGFSSDRESIYSTDGTALEPTDKTLSLPVVVICSEHTASAGELFTGAVKDFREMGLMNSTVVGKTTYKKGVMQTTFQLGGGETITITTAYYFSPLGANNDIDGVSPDVFVEDKDDYLTTAISEMNKLLNR